MPTKKDTPRPDVIEVLSTQHDRIKQLMTKVAAAKGQAVADTFCELRRQLVVHETAEQEIVYPILRSVGKEGSRLADTRTGEEVNATKVLAALENLEPASAEFMALFDEFSGAVLSHAEQEEHDVLPLLRDTQTPDRLEQMAVAFDAAEKAAPTHAHPHGPTSAIGNVVVGPALAIMDRVRDAIHTH